MQDTAPSLIKVGITTLVMVVSIIAMIIVFNVSRKRGQDVLKKVDTSTLNDNIADFQVMESYNKPIPVPQVVAALERYGTPEAFCLQMEDLKGQGSPYPFAYQSPEDVDALVQKLKNYYDKKVYVYMAKPNGVLQLCVSELPHYSNQDANNQVWEVR